MNTRLGLFSALVLFAILAGCGGTGGSAPGGGGTTSAQTTGEKAAPHAVPAAVTLDLTPSRGSDVSGTADFRGEGMGVEIVLKMQNLPGQPGAQYPAHIHEGGTCADDRAGNEASIRFPLTSVVAEEGGTGTSTTMIDNVTMAELFSGPPKYVNVHAEKTDGETPPGISCADLFPGGSTIPSGSVIPGGTTTPGTSG